MTTKLLNQYKATYEGNATSLCTAETMADACDVLDQDTEPLMLQRVAAGIKVVVPDAALSFKTSVDATAYTAGCRAYPATGGEVLRGQKLYLSAVAGDGYEFIGWYQGDTEISTDLEAVITVESTAQVPSIITYEAKFQLQS